MTQPMLEVTGAAKAFGKVTALSGVDLTVPPGRIAALLGPNGAGKTTLVRIVATLVRPDAGQIRVAGFDVVADPYAVRARIGLTGQYAGLDEALPGRANLMLIGRLAGLSRGTARGRAAELIGRFDLAAAAGRAVGTYSGGMRRADLAASLMARGLAAGPDEPTTGLDPAGRRQLWESLARCATRHDHAAHSPSTLRKPTGSLIWCTSWIRGRLVASGTPASCAPDRNPAGRGAVRALSVAAAAARCWPARRLGLPPEGLHGGPGVRAARPPGTA
jgi:ABC-type multidrug transport system ATPase subunit